MTTAKKPNPDRVSLARHRATIDRLRVLSSKLGPLQAEYKALEAEIKAAMGDATTGTIGRETVATWTTTTRQTIDQKALKAEQPELALKYTRTTAVRSFRITDPV